MSTIEGVDYTTDARPTVAGLLAAGKAFACRYGGPGGAWKQLTAVERDLLHAAGIAIVANAEGTADGLKGGYAAGASWARDALDFWTTLGLPSDRPIYFSVDFDTTSGNYDELDAAMDGAASVIGRERVGVYGEYDLITHFVRNGKARWYWQAYAWSHGMVNPSAHIYQYRNGVPLGGGTVDLDRALKADYGQWTGDEDMADTEGDTALQYRVLALLDLDEKWANDPHIVAAGRLANVPVIDLLNRLDAAAKDTAVKAALAAVAAGVTSLQASVTALAAKLDALATKVGPAATVDTAAVAKATVAELARELTD